MSSPKLNPGIDTHVKMTLNIILVSILFGPTECFMYLKYLFLSMQAPLKKPNIAFPGGQRKVKEKKIRK